MSDYARRSPSGVDGAPLAPAVTDQQSAEVERIRTGLSHVIAQSVEQDDDVAAAFAALDALAQRIETLTRERDEAREFAVDKQTSLLKQWRGAAERAEAQRERLAEALREIRAQQPETLETIRSNGFVFDSIGNEPGNWQHLAFTIYNDLCRVESLAAGALSEIEQAASNDGEKEAVT